MWIYAKKNDVNQPINVLKEKCCVNLMAKCCLQLQKSVKVRDATKCYNTKKYWSKIKHESNISQRLYCQWFTRVSIWYKAFLSGWILLGASLMNQHTRELIRAQKDTPLVEFTYLVVTRIPGESYHRQLRSLLLCLCDVSRALINSLACWFCTCALGLVLFQICLFTALFWLVVFFVKKRAWSDGNGYFND